MYEWSTENSRTSGDSDGEQSADESAQWELREQCEQIALDERVGQSGLRRLREKRRDLVHVDDVPAAAAAGPAGRLVPLSTGAGARTVLYRTTDGS